MSAAHLLDVAPPDAALLDAIPDATAVVDGAGAIVAVNRAWRMFTVDNGGDPARTSVGTNYLDVCARSAADGCADAVAVTAGLRAVMDGHTVESDLEYPCPSPEVGRWFVLRVTPIDGPERRMLISHVNISRRKLAEQDMERRATLDPLTGLGNRSLFSQRLASALTPRPHRPAEADVGLLYLDLDGFKPVNDTYGHAAGDEVLRVAAARMTQVVRPQDTLARMGGDEFAVVAPRITARGLVGLEARISEALSHPYLIHGGHVDVGASVGAHLARSGDDLDEVVARADEAMYRVKATRVGRG